MDDAELKRLMESHTKETRAHFDVVAAEMKTETRRHFDIVTEELRRELQLVAEGVARNSERIERLEVSVESLVSDVDSRLTRLEATSR